MDPDGMLNLLALVMQGTQPLPGAACDGRHELYDPMDATMGADPNAEYQRAAAAKVCRNCLHVLECPHRVTVDTAPEVAA